MGDLRTAAARWLSAALGVLILVASPGANAATYKYDAQGRLIAVIYDDGTGDRIDYRYDAAGNRTSVVTSTTPGNRPPAATANFVTLSVAEGSSAAAISNPRGNFTDPDNATSTLQVAGITQGAKGVVSFTPSNTLTYDVNPGVSGHESGQPAATDSFVYSVKDSTGAYGTTVVQVTITNVAPVAVADSVSVNKNSFVNIPVLANDTDAGLDQLRLGTISSQSHGTATPLENGTVNFVPTGGYTGAASFRYTVIDEDGKVSASTGLVSITVNNVNNPPVANDDSFYAQVSTARTFDPRYNDTDADGNSLSITGKTNGAHGTVSFTSTSVSYTPTTGYTGADNFTYTISDGAGGTDTATVLMTVITNTAPDAVNDTQIVGLNTPATFDPRANDTDADNHSLTITAVTTPTHGGVIINGYGGSVTYTPNTGYSGADSFTYTIADLPGATDTATVSLTVGGANTPPVAVDDDLTAANPFGTPAVGSVNVLANDTDAQGQTLSIVSVTNGAKGTVGFVGGVVTYTTNAGNTVGVDSFTYTVSDGAGGTDVGTVSVTIERN